MPSQTRPIRSQSHSRKPAGREFPLAQLYCYLTEGCNLACRHCWLAPRHDAEGRHTRMLPVPLFEAAVAEALALGLQTVKLTGGEPLLHPRFTAFLDIVEKRQLGLNLETNGVLLTAEIAGRLASIAPLTVSVSVDGADADTHDAIRGVPGSFHRAMAGIGHLTAAGIAPQMILTLMPSNIDQIDAYVAMAQEIGAGSVKFNILQPVGRGERLSQSLGGFSIRRLLETGRYVDRELARRSTIPLYFDLPMAFRPLSRIHAGAAGNVCGILGILGIIPSGRYALCGIGSHVDDLVFGRVGSDRLAAVWRRHPVLAALREGLPRRLEGICGDCLMNTRCLGSCIAQNYFRSGRLWAPFWLCRAAEQAGRFPRSRLRRPA